MPHPHSGTTSRACNFPRLWHIWLIAVCVVTTSFFCGYMMSLSDAQVPPIGHAALFSQATKNVLRTWSPSAGRELAASKGTSHTLVLYVFSNSDELYLGNLKFFVEYGMPGCPGCRYTIIVNADENQPAGTLPDLPENAWYVQHPNRCYDWGTFGWAFRTGVADPKAYQYYIFMNSSVRGPFLPSYLQGHVHFTDVLTKKLTADVKLVGPYISCGSLRRPTMPWSGENPHVQSFVAAMDSIALNILLQNQTVFDCYDDKYITILHSEFGISDAIMRAGYNLDCLLDAYRGINWRDQSNWQCNGQRNPFSISEIDGVPISLMEVMFAKVKSRDASRYNLTRAALAAANFYGVSHD